VPDNFHSAAVTSGIEAEKAEKAGTPLPGDTPLPKVVTAAGESTIPGRGRVSSNIFQKSEHIREFVGIDEGRAEKSTSNTTASGAKVASPESRKATLGSLQNSAPDFAFAAAPDELGESDPHRSELDSNDVKGLYVLGGILAGGWLLGGLLSRKGVEPAKHS